MRVSLAILTSLFLVISSTHAEDSPFPDGAAPRQYGGFMFIRQGNQTTVSLGGVLIARRVKVTTATPEGSVVTRFLLPSVFHVPNSVPLPQSAPALLKVEIPDHYGLLYIEGEMVRTVGTTRQLQSPDLPPGKAIPIHLRAAFQSGDHLLIEDKQIQIQAGESNFVKFDGSGAVSVPLPR